MAKEEKNCFVIAPIGPEESEIRERSDQLLEHVIRPTAEECGYKAIRADEIAEPGRITDQVITHVINDSMVVADLTGWNPNVFYELAIRHAVRKPFVLLFQQMNEKDRIPFDVADLRVVHLDYPNWASIEPSRAELIKAIKAAEGMDPEKLVTPITHAINLQQLSESEDPIANVLAAIPAYLQTIDAKITLMQHNIRRLEGAIAFLRTDLISRTSTAAMEDIIDEIIRRKAGLVS